MFTKHDLKTGMFVKLRDGSIGFVARSCANRHVGKSSYHLEDMILFFKKNTSLEMCMYNEDMTYYTDHNYDIMQVVCQLCYPAFNDADLYFKNEHNILFDRENNTGRKKLTVKEVEELLGYKVAIVDKEGK